MTGGTRLQLVDTPHCDYFEAGKCRSCVLIETPYRAQLREKEDRSRELLPSVPESAWLPSVPGGTRDFRNRAKLVVGGRAGHIALGILGPDGHGIDLRDCLIHEPVIREAIPRIAKLIETAGIVPYDVPTRRGELKFVHITAAPDGALMLRFVTRGERGLAAIRRLLPDLRRELPEAAVISVNLLPEHKAVLEGEREELLHGSALTMRLDEVSLHLRPQSFFQTNTAVARALYAQAAAWVDKVDPASLWDLYCGVGGFALHCAGTGNTRQTRRVLGVELSSEAVRSARRSARDAGIDASFVAADATEYARDADRSTIPELVIVNPPRRGIGPELSAWLERASVAQVIYSSCNPESLARDLSAMPSYRVQYARVFDMFPHTRHLEVAVLLQRVG